MTAYTENWGKPFSEQEQTLETYRSAEFLVLEEIGKEIDSKIAKPILEDLLRYREEQGYITIICSNMTPTNLREIYGSSVCSLINGTMTVVIIESEDKRQEVFNGEL